MTRVEPIYGIPDDVASFVAGRLGFTRGFGNCTAIGFGLKDDRTITVIAGVVYHNYNPEAGVIELSAAALSPRWLTRAALLAIFDFPFEKAGCQMVVLRVSERNERMLSIARRFGFELHTIPRLRGCDEAEVICTLTAERWTTNKTRLARG